MKEKNKNLVHKTFEISIFLKGLNGFLETVFGVFLLLVSQKTIQRLAEYLSQSEFSEDPQDRLAHYLFHLANNFSVSSQYFAAAFFLSHGLLKLLLIVALYKRKLWAYPLAIAVFTAFIVFQMRRYFLFHSVWMLGLSILDVGVIWLTVMEYKNLKTTS